MPVISQNLFLKRMTEFSKTKKADFAILFLSICLLIYCPLTDTTQLPLYKAVKAEFWHSHSQLEPSTEMVQADLLISCYEYASGLVKASYHTIGTCARMGSWMGLQNQRLTSDLPKDTDN
jgi:hypothetical protein